MPQSDDLPLSKKWHDAMVIYCESPFRSTVPSPFAWSESLPACP